MKRKSSVLMLGLCISFLAGCSLTKSKSAPAANAPSSASGHADQTSRPPGDSTTSTTGGNDQSATANTGDEIKDQLHTPAKGSDERQAIMDALRAEFDNRQSPYYKPQGYRADQTKVSYRTNRYFFEIE